MDYNKKVYFETLAGLIKREKFLTEESKQLNIMVASTTDQYVKQEVLRKLFSVSKEKLEVTQGLANYPLDEIYLFRQLGFNYFSPSSLEKAISTVKSDFKNRGARVKETIEQTHERLSVAVLFLMAILLVQYPERAGEILGVAVTNNLGLAIGFFIAVTLSDNQDLKLSEKLFNLNYSSKQNNNNNKGDC